MRLPLCRPKPAIARVAIRMCTHTCSATISCRNLAFSVHLQPLEHSSQKDRSCVKDPQRSPCPWRIEYRRQLHERKSQNLSTHWQAIHLLHCKRLEPVSFLELIYRRQQSFGKKIHENYRGRDHFIWMMQ